MSKDRFEEALKRELERGAEETPAQKEHIEVMSQLLRKQPDSKKDEGKLRSFMGLCAKQ